MLAYGIYSVYAAQWWPALQWRRPMSHRNRAAPDRQALMLDPQSRFTSSDECFVRIPLADARSEASPAPASREVVLARCDGAVWPDALVVARREERVALCRVARVTDDAVELLPVEDGDAPLRLGRGDPGLLGTVLLRWRDDVAVAPPRA